MRHPRLALALCLAGTLAVPAYLRAREPRPLAELIAAAGPAPPEVVFIFDPGDCRLRADAIEAMNRVAARPRTTVRGVMLAPPVIPREAEGLVRAFGIRFPVTLDRDGEWRAAVDAGGLAFPVVLVKRGGRYVRTGDPHRAASLYSLVSDALGGEE